MKLIGIKYCGGCNPIIDRAKMVREIEKLLPPECSLSKDQSSNNWDIGILICGCLTACADKPEFKNLARKWIIVAGNSIDHNNALEKEIAGIVVDKIRSYNNNDDDNSRKLFKY
jgi:hypothetical protein